jgi:hypothetical protein
LKDNIAEEERHEQEQDKEMAYLRYTQVRKMVRTLNINFGPAHRNHNQPAKLHLKSHINLMGDIDPENKPNQKLIVAKKNTNKNTPGFCHQKVITTKNTTDAAKKPIIVAVKKPTDAVKKGAAVAQKKSDAAHAKKPAAVVIKKPAVAVVVKNAAAAKKPYGGKKKAAPAKKPAVGKKKVAVAAAAKKANTAKEPAKSRNTMVTSMKKLVKAAHSRSKDIVAGTKVVGLAGAPIENKRNQVAFLPPIMGPVQ